MPPKGGEGEGAAMTTTANRRGYFPLLAFCLTIAMLVCACQVIPQRDVVALEDTIYLDGSIGAKGSEVFVGVDGKDTARPVDVGTGKPNKRARELDGDATNKKGEKLIEKGSAWLPAPFGWLLYIIGAGGLAGVGAYIKRKNEERRKAGGGRKRI